MLSLSIFTRLPIPASTPYSESRKNQSYKYAGLVGLVVGVLVAMVYSLAMVFWTVEVSVVLSMAFGVSITGAFHEDGFADTCDGFGGGYTPDRKLTIMKDSRVGAYALLGMVLILLLKYQSLVSLEQIPMALVIAHVLSRTVAVSFTYSHQYVRQEEGSKLKIAKSPTHYKDGAVLAGLAFLTLLLIPDFKTVTVLVLTLMAVRFWLSRWMVRQIGGYTGDVLGAVQQVTEVTCYLVFLALQS